MPATRTSSASNSTACRSPRSSSRWRVRPRTTSSSPTPPLQARSAPPDPDHALGRPHRSLPAPGNLHGGDCRHGVGLGQCTPRGRSGCPGCCSVGRCYCVRASAARPAVKPDRRHQHYAPVASPWQREGGDVSGMLGWCTDVGLKRTPGGIAQPVRIRGTSISGRTGVPSAFTSVTMASGRLRLGCVGRSSLPTRAARWTRAWMLIAAGTPMCSTAMRPAARPRCGRPPTRGRRTSPRSRSDDRTSLSYEATPLGHAVHERRRRQEASGQKVHHAAPLWNSPGPHAQ